METVPHLLHFGISHFNEKVRWALDYKGWSHTREALVPGFHVPRVRRLTGHNRVPVLKIGDEILTDSAHILNEIERRRPEPALFPVDLEERRQAMSVQAYFDAVAPEVRRLFWACYVPHPVLASRMACKGEAGWKQGLWLGLFPLLLPVFSQNLGLMPWQLKAARQRLSGHLDWLEARIGPQGYLIGGQFSVADLCAAAVMTAIIRPPQFPYPLAEPWPEELHQLRDSISQRDGFHWVLDIYRQHRCPSAEIDRGTD